MEQQQPKDRTIKVKDHVVYVDEHGQQHNALVTANLIGQHGVGVHKSIPPVRYDAIAKGLEQVAIFAKTKRGGILAALPIHMPRIGCGLAGGDWDKIAPLLENKLDGLEVTVYDLP